MPKNNKPKVKRKRGKKFTYKEETEKSQTKQVLSNPFEAISKKKFMKAGNQYEQLRKEYQNSSSVNSFSDRRLGESSRLLSLEDKMKMRFKAQQLVNSHNLDQSQE